MLPKMRLIVIYEKSAKKKNLGEDVVLVSASYSDHWSAAINFFCRIFLWGCQEYFMSDYFM